MLTNLEVTLPNIRKIFVPDPGYVIFDADLKGADAQVVAWEAEDEDLKKAFAEGLDVHVKNAEDMMGSRFTSLTPDSPLWKSLRSQNKVAVHLSNYGGKARTLAISQRWKVAEAQSWQDNWFHLHPGIRDWHDRVQIDLERNRTIWNKFGYRIIYFDRVGGLLPEALAWIPQSTVALISFKGALRLRKELPWTQLLLQVHDSLVFQVPVHREDQTRLLLSTLEVEVPYPDPLLIPWSLKKSHVSWGDCQKVA